MWESTSDSPRGKTELVLARMVLVEEKYSLVSEVRSARSLRSAEYRNRE